MKNVNQGIRKKDAMALLTGKPVYMDDLAPRDCLIVKVLRSPHANAMIQSVKTDAATPPVHRFRPHPAPAAFQTASPTFGF